MALERHYEQSMGLVQGVTMDHASRLDVLTVHGESADHRQDIIAQGIQDVRGFVRVTLDRVDAMKLELDVQAKALEARQSTRSRTRSTRPARRWRRTSWAT